MTTHPPKRVLITGGARSGKSRFAESQLADFPEVDYVATSTDSDDDPEWAERIELHRARRPDTWKTIETCDLVGVLEQDGPPVLIDCLSLWLADACSHAGVWEQAPEANAKLALRVDDVVEAWTRSPRHVIAVTNEVGAGVVPDTMSGRRYRDELGILNARIAAVSHETWVLIAGRPLLLP